MLTVLNKTGRHGLAEVYLGMVRRDPGLLVEFVDACDPALGGRDRKWVVVVSTQLGCPVGCLMCDAGSRYQGNLSAAEIMAQVEQVVAANGRDPNDSLKFKVQFARMGEPALNGEVLRALWALKERWPQVIPCVATVAPAGRDRWFDALLALREYFRDFQLQFSVNSTDDGQRDRLMPYPKMPWQAMARYGRRFYRPGQRKPALNFAVGGDWELDAAALASRFDPRWFAVKLTPLNPTATAAGNGLAAGGPSSLLDRSADELRSRGFDVIVSIGDPGENDIGSNCGQAVWRHRHTGLRAAASPAR
ncbi:MAG: radical SAM protein [Candidatus Edwardsbacteria bacterium]|jgi:23S rRNA (adenine2503-C2)-methyltransferase|nr:radical SAM protein [Candidatus Edwardsbacteria bacterium]